MILRFEAPVGRRIQNFLGSEDPHRYLLAWETQWCDRTPKERVHLCIHGLGLRPNVWYVDTELHKHTSHWETLRDEFLRTFRMVEGAGALDAALQNTDALT